MTIIISMLKPRPAAEAARLQAEFEAQDRVRTEAAIALATAKATAQRSQFISRKIAQGRTYQEAIRAYDNAR